MRPIICNKYLSLARWTRKKTTLSFVTKITRENKRKRKYCIEERFKKKKDNIFDVLLDSVPFVQFKKREKHPWHTYVCVSGGKKSCFFFGKFGSFCFLVTHILRLVLFPYNWQNVVVLKGFTKLPGLCKGILPRKFFKIISYPFSTIVPLLYLLKTSENRRFFDVFKGYRSGTLFENGLTFSRCNSSLIYWLPIIQM